MNSEKPTRTSKGQFTKGSGGRPKGAKNRSKSVTPAEFHAAASAKAATQLQGLLDKALSVVDQKLDAGDVRAAMWVLDRSLPKPQMKLTPAIPDADLSSIEGIIQASQKVAEMALSGEIGLDEGSRLQTVLSNTATLLGYRRIDELRDMIEMFEQQGGPKAIVELPLWGRLQERLKN